MLQKPFTPQNCPQNLQYLRKCLSKCGDYISPKENKTPWCYRKSKKFKSLKKSPQLQLCEQLNRELCLAASKSCCLIEDTATEWYRKVKELKVLQIDQKKSISAPCLDLKPNIREMAALAQKESIPLPSAMNEIKSVNYISPEFQELLRQHDERVKERYVLNRLPREYTKRRKRKKKEKVEEQPFELEKEVEWRNICSCEKIEFKKVVKKCQAPCDIPEENVSCCGLCKKKKVKKEEGPKKPENEDEDKIKCCGLCGKKLDKTETKSEDLKTLEKEDEDKTRFCGLCSRKPDKTEPISKEPLKKEKAPDDVKTRFCGLCTKKPPKTETKPKQPPKEKPPPTLEKEEDENVKCCGFCKKKREEIKPETPSKPVPQKPIPPPLSSSPAIKKTEKPLETPKPSEPKESKSRLSNCFKCFKSKEKPAEPLQPKEDIKILPPPSDDLRPRYLNFKRGSSQISQEDEEERDSVTEKRKINLTPRIRANKEAKSYDLRDSSSSAVIELVKPQFKRGSRKSKERVKGGAYSIKIAKPVRGNIIQRYKGGASTEEIPEQCTCAKPQEIWTKTHGTQTLKEYDNLPEWYTVQRRSSLDSEENKTQDAKCECFRKSIDSGYRRSSLRSYDSLQERDICKPRYSLESRDVRKTRSSLDSREYKAADEECKCTRSSIESGHRGSSLRETRSFLESPEYKCECRKPTKACAHQTSSYKSSQEYTKQALQCECARSSIDSSQQRSSSCKKSSLESQECTKESLKCECARSSIDSTQNRFSCRRSALDSQECTNQSLICECARSSLDSKCPRSSLASKESARTCRNSTCSLQSQNTNCSTETLTQCQCKDIQPVSCFQQQKQKPNYLRMQGLVSSYWQHPTPYPLPKPKPKKKISCECNKIPNCEASSSSLTLCSNNICHRTRSSGGNCQGLNKPCAGKRLVGFGNTAKARKSSSICTSNICDALRSNSPSKCSKVSGNFNICPNAPNICDCSKPDAQLCPNVALNICECSQPVTPNICACSKPVNCVSSNTPNICDCSKPDSQLCPNVAPNICECSQPVTPNICSCSKPVNCVSSNICNCSKSNAQLCPSICKQDTPKICDCSKPKAQMCPHLNNPPSCISPICNCAKNICSPTPPSCITPNSCNCVKDVCSSPPPCNSPNICNCPPPQICSCSKPVIQNCSPVYQQEVCISPNNSPYSCDCPPTDAERYSTIYDSNEPRTSRLPSQSIAGRTSSMYNENERRSSRMPSQSIAERVSQMYDQSKERRPTRISSLRDVERLSKALVRNTRTSNYSQAETRFSRMSRVPQERFSMVPPPLPSYYNTKICESYAQVPPNACLCPGSKSYPNISQAFCEAPQQIQRICLCANEGRITKSYSTIPLRDSVRFSTRPLDEYENYELDEFGEPLNRYSTRISRQSRSERPTLQPERAVSWSPRMHNSSVFLEGMPDIGETKEPKPSNVNRWSKAFRSQGTTRRSRKLANMRRSKSQNLNEDADYYTEDDRYRSKSLDSRYSTRPVDDFEDEYPRYSQGYDANRYSYQPESLRECKCSRPSLIPQFSNLRECKCDIYRSKSFREPADFRECNCDIYNLRQSQNIERFSNKSFMQPANFRECKCDISNFRQSSIGPSNFKECSCDESFKNCECFPEENFRECNCPIPTLRQSRKSIDSYRPKECKCASSYEDLRRASQTYKECKCGSDSEDLSENSQDLELCECEIPTNRPSRKKINNSRANNNNIKCCCSSDSVNQRRNSSIFVSRKSKSLDKNRGRFNSGSDVIEDCNRNTNLSKRCRCKRPSYELSYKNTCKCDSKMKRSESTFSRQCKCGKSNIRCQNSNSLKCDSGARGHRTVSKSYRTCKCSSRQSNKKCDHFGSISSNKCDCSSDSEDEETEKCKCHQSKRNSSGCGECKCSISKSRQSSKSPQHCSNNTKEIEGCKCNSKCKEQKKVPPACKCSTSNYRQSNNCIDSSKSKSSNKNACKCSASSKDRGRTPQISKISECQSPARCSCEKKAEACDLQSCKKLPHECPSAMKKMKCNCKRSNSCKAESSDSDGDNCKCCSTNMKEKGKYCSCKEESSEDECKCSAKTKKRLCQYTCHCNSCNDKSFEDDNDCKCKAKCKTSKKHSLESKECKCQTKTSCPYNKESKFCKCDSKTKASSSCNRDKERRLCKAITSDDECKCSSKSKTPGSNVKKHDPQELAKCYYPSENKTKSKHSSHDKTKSYTEFESRTRSKDKKRMSSEINKSSRSLPNTPGSSLTKNYTPPAKEKGKQSRSLNCFKNSKDKKTSQESLEQYSKEKEENQRSSSSSTSLSSSRSSLSNECQRSSETTQSDSKEEKFCTCNIKGKISETSLKEIVSRRRRRSKGGSSGTEDIKKTQELKKKSKQVKLQDLGKEGKSYYNDKAITYTNTKSLQRKQEETVSRCNRTSKSQKTNSVTKSSAVLKDIFVKNLEKSKENNPLKTTVIKKENPKPFRKLINRNTNEISQKSLKNYSLRMPLEEIFLNNRQRSKGGSQNESKTKIWPSSEISQEEIKKTLKSLTEIHKVSKSKRILKEKDEQKCSNSNAESIPSPPKCNNIELSLYSATYFSGDDESSSISINEILSENRLTAKEVSDFDKKNLPNLEEIKVKLHRVSQSESFLNDKVNKIQFYTSHSSLNTMKVSSPKRFKCSKNSSDSSVSNAEKSFESFTTSFQERSAEVEIENNPKIANRNVKETNESNDVLPGAASSKTIEFIYSPNNSSRSSKSSIKSENNAKHLDTSDSHFNVDNENSLITLHRFREDSSSTIKAKENNDLNSYYSSSFIEAKLSQHSKESNDSLVSSFDGSSRNNDLESYDSLLSIEDIKSKEESKKTTESSFKVITKNIDSHVKPQKLSPIKSKKLSKDSSENSEEQTSDEEVNTCGSESEISSSSFLFKNSINRKRYKGGASENPDIKKSQENLTFLENNQPDTSPERTLPTAEEQIASAEPEHSEVKDHQVPSLTLKKTKKCRNLSMCCTRQRSQSSDSDTSRGSKKSNPLLLCFKDSLCCTVCRRKKKIPLPPPETPEEIVIEDEPQPPAPKKCKLPLRPPGAAKFRALANSSLKHLHCFKDSYYWLGIPDNYPQMYQEIAKRQQLERERSAARRAKLWGDKCPRAQPTKAFYEARKTREISPGHRKCFDVIDECDEVKKKKFIRKSPCPCKKHKHNCVGEERAKRGNMKPCPCHQRERMWQSYSISSFKSYESSTERNKKTKDTIKKGKDHGKQLIKETDRGIKKAITMDQDKEIQKKYSKANDQKEERKKERLLKYKDSSESFRNVKSTLKEEDNRRNRNKIRLLEVKKEKENLQKFEESNKIIKNYKEKQQEYEKSKESKVRNKKEKFKAKEEHANKAETEQMISKENSESINNSKEKQQEGVKSKESKRRSKEEKAETKNVHTKEEKYINKAEISSKRTVENSKVNETRKETNMEQKNSKERSQSIKNSKEKHEEDSQSKKIKRKSKNENKEMSDYKKKDASSTSIRNSKVKKSKDDSKKGQDPKSKDSNHSIRRTSKRQQRDVAKGTESRDLKEDKHHGTSPKSKESYQNLKSNEMKEQIPKPRKRSTSLNIFKRFSKTKGKKSSKSSSEKLTKIQGK